MPDDPRHHDLPPEDARLLAELGDLLARVDAPTPAADELARAALSWRTLDAELAELVADSALSEQLAGVRSGGGPRLVSFRAGDLDVELEIEPGDGDRRRLVGQLLPPTRAQLTVEHAAGAGHADADELGRFRAEDVPPGPVRLRIARPGAGAVVTEWVRL